MAAKKATDTYANYAALNITESAANTFTATKFAFPFSIMDKMGLVISRIEYDFTGLTGVLAAGSDTIVAGICANQTVADVDKADDPYLVDTLRLRLSFWGAAANAQVLVMPMVKDFTSLAGGGILVAPSPLYGFVKGISAGAAASISIRLFYTYLELGTDEYWQLVESRRIIGA